MPMMHIPMPLSPKSLRLPQSRPPGRPIGRASKVGRVDKGLRDGHRMAVDLIPIGGKPPRIERQDFRGKIRNMYPRENQKAGIVDHGPESGSLLGPSPFDPLVARPTHPRRRCPSEQGDPGLVETSDIIERFADQASKS